jgi:hypothetical protein
MVERDVSHDWEQQETEAAARAAAAIGGRSGDEALDPALRPLIEGGEGEAEGFELAEADLIEAAESGGDWADPTLNALTVEAETQSAIGPYGEPDHEASSERPDTDR